MKKIGYLLGILLLLSACSHTKEEYALYQEQVTSITESQLSKLEGFFVFYDEFLTDSNDEALRHNLLAATKNSLDGFTTVNEKLETLSLPRGNNEFNREIENYHQTILFYYALLSVLLTEVQTQVETETFDDAKIKRYLEQLEAMEKIRSTSMQNIEDLLG